MNFANGLNRVLYPTEYSPPRKVLVEVYLPVRELGVEIDYEAGCVWLIIERERLDGTTWRIRELVPL